MLKLNKNYSDYIDTSDSNYPEGKAINASSSESYDGTPLLAEFMNDINAAHIAMYEKAYGNRTGINGQPDTQKSSQFANAVAKYTDDKVTAHDNKRGLADGVHGATSSAKAGQIACRDASGNIAVGSAINDGDAVNKAYLNNFIETLLKEKIYHVGYIMYTDKADNPSTYLGFGTWVRIKGRFVWAADDTDEIGYTGGDKTVTLTTTQIPSHTHTFTGTTNQSTGNTQPTFTGKAVTSGNNSVGHTHNFTPSGNVGSHYHGLNNHTHNMEHYHDRGTMEITGSQQFRQLSGNSSPFLHDGNPPAGAFSTSSKSSTSHTSIDTAGSASTRYILNFKASDAWTGLTSNTKNSSGTDIKVTGGSSANTADAQPSFTGIRGTTEGISANHTHSVTASGTVSSHSHTYTAAGTNSKTGGGEAHNNMPPYEVHYCWRRIA